MSDNLTPEEKALIRRFARWLDRHQWKIYLVLGAKLFLVLEAALDRMGLAEHRELGMGLLGGNSGSDQGGQDCSTIIGAIIGAFLGCV